MRLYKATRSGGHPCHGGHGAWPLPRGSRPGKWRKESGPLRLCFHSTLHLCRDQDLLYWLGEEIWVAEAKGEIEIGDDKVGCLQARLVAPTLWDARRSRLFAADCAEWALRYAQADQIATLRRTISIARQYARGRDVDLSATYSAAWATAGSAAYSAAYSAAGSAAGAWQTKRLLRYLHDAHEPRPYRWRPRGQS